MTFEDSTKTHFGEPPSTDQPPDYSPYSAGQDSIILRKVIRLRKP
jgi:hypothetical protein